MNDTTTSIDINDVTADTYVDFADRTACPLGPVLERIAKDPEKALALIHMVIGKAGELGELASAIQRWLFYGKDLDIPNLIEELGDDAWYTACGLKTLDVTLEAILRVNILKLRERYPDKFTEYDAAEEHRDRSAEREILEALNAGEAAGASERGPGSAGNPLFFEIQRGGAMKALNGHSDYDVSRQGSIVHRNVKFTGASIEYGLHFRDYNGSPYTVPIDQLTDIRVSPSDPS